MDLLTPVENQAIFVVFVHSHTSKPANKKNEFFSLPAFWLCCQPRRMMHGWPTYTQHHPAIVCVLIFCQSGAIPTAVYLLLIAIPYRFTEHKLNCHRTANKTFSIQSILHGISFCINTNGSINPEINSNILYCRNTNEGWFGPQVDIKMAV